MEENYQEKLKYLLRKLFKHYKKGGRLVLIRDAIREYSNTGRKESLVQLVQQLRENGGEDLYASLLVMKMFENDYPELLSELGDCYYQGEGVKKDIQHALKMFNTAATRGSVRSQYDS